MSYKSAKKLLSFAATVEDVDDPAYTVRLNTFGNNGTDGAICYTKTLKREEKVTRIKVHELLIDYDDDYKILAGMTLETSEGNIYTMGQTDGEVKTHEKKFKNYEFVGF